jgi:hypothetical protein
LMFLPAVLSAGPRRLLRPSPMRLTGVCEFRKSFCGYRVLVKGAPHLWQYFVKLSTSVPQFWHRLGVIGGADGKGSPTSAVGSAGRRRSLSRRKILILLIICVARLSRMWRYDLRTKGT